VEWIALIFWIMIGIGIAIKACEDDNDDLLRVAKYLILIVVWPVIAGHFWAASQKK